jgi:primase-polymerase (primpol)-like protein
LSGFERLASEKEVAAYKRDKKSLNYNRLQAHFHKGRSELKMVKGQGNQLAEEFASLAVILEEKKQKLAKVTKKSVELTKNMMEIEKKNVEFARRAGLMTRHVMMIDFDGLETKIKKHKVKLAQLEHCKAQYTR